eukprot:scaffold189_cov188-Amphora_coffeaeformis.AAC.2
MILLSRGHNEKKFSFSAAAGSENSQGNPEKPRRDLLSHQGPRSDHQQCLSVPILPYSVQYAPFHGSAETKERNNLGFLMMNKKFLSQCVLLLPVCVRVPNA